MIFDEFINRSYLTDSYIGLILKMESVTKNTIFGLKMMLLKSRGPILRVTSSEKLLRLC